jgi:sarcosine oxidase subunit alpha
MQFCHQVLWPALDVQFISVTDEWAQYAVAGPRAREKIAKIVDAPFDVANDALPYMGVAKVAVCGGVPARLYRLSFSGELGYEIGVPARYGITLADVLLQVGAEYGIVPYGIEALGVMRIEKGHVGGNKIDGRTTAGDLGLGRLMSAKKDFVGRVMATRPALVISNDRSSSACGPATQAGGFMPARIFCRSAPHIRPITIRGWSHPPPSRRP